MGSSPGGPPRLNLNQERILVESIKKELKHQTLYTTYTQNPFTDVFVYTEKPNVQSQVGGIDENLRCVIQRSRMEPRKKYSEPKTENQTYGWDSEPLISRPRNDRRFFFGRKECEVTRFIESDSNQKNSSRNNNRKSA